MTQLRRQKRDQMKSGQTAGDYAPEAQEYSEYYSHAFDSFDLKGRLKTW